MTDKCIHQPTPQPGNVCECLACRTARAKTFGAIVSQCVRCSGRCATDAQGMFTCEKGDYGCPVLDLWLAVKNRVVDPAKIGAMQVELVYNRHKDPPKRYRRVGVGLKPTHAAVVNPALAPVVKRAKKPIPRPVLSVEENTPELAGTTKRAKRG